MSAMKQDHHSTLLLVEEASSSSSAAAATNSPSSSGPAFSEWETVSSKKKKKMSQREGATPPRTNPHQSKNEDPSVRIDGPIDPTRSRCPSPFLLLLVGPPGSGKTTFATTLQHKRPQCYVHVNQDTLGSRAACETLSRRVLRDPLQCDGIVLLDRCNLSLDQRRIFSSIAREMQVPIECVEFKFGTEECIQRCRQRRGHTTLHPNKARQVVERMMLEYTEPHAEKEGYRRMYKVTDGESFQKVMQEYITRV